MRIWFDTEFIEDGKTIDLISIGMAREDGEKLYLESIECDLSKSSPWVVENVLPQLEGSFQKTRECIAKQIVKFAGYNPIFWAYFADYDWVALCQLYGTMMDLPDSWPMFCMDVKQVAVEKGINKVPPHNGNVHNALADACWAHDYHRWLEDQ